MPGIKLPDISLSGAIVGQVYKLVFPIGTFLPATATQNSYNRPAWLRVWNESGVGLDFVAVGGTDTGSIPAGGWYDLEMEPDVQQINFTVSYILQGAGVSLLKSTYYLPGQSPPPMAILGNSPVGFTGSLTVSSVVISGHDNWIITQDASGNLDFEDTTTGVTYVMGNAAPGTFTAPELTVTDAVQGIGGQATNGSFGVAPIYQDSGLVHVTLTSATIIFSLAVPASQPCYRLSGTLNVANGGASTCTLSVAYNDVRGVARTQFFNTYGGTAVNAAALATGDYPLEAMELMNIFSSANLIITYTDSSGTPNDRVRIFIERIG